MTYHEFKNGITVMDGNRCVAVAKPMGHHGWKMIIHNGSWADYRARTQGIAPGRYPHLMLVKTRCEAAKILKELSRTAYG